MLAQTLTYVFLYKIKCFIHLHSSPLPSSFPFNEHVIGSGHQLPLSSHICLESFFALDLDQALYLRPASDPHISYQFNSSLRLPPLIKLLRWRGGEGNYMDLWFCLTLLCPHRKHMLTLLARVHPYRWKKGYIIREMIFSLRYSFGHFRNNI